MYKSAKIVKLLRIPDVSAKQNLLYAEKNNLIPPAERIQTGCNFTRHWRLTDIPAIGSYFNIFPKPKKQIIISTYACKGGVLKTALSVNIARMLALHGIKTIAIDLNSIQASLTNFLLPRKTDSLEKIREGRNGLWKYFNKEIEFNNIIYSTDLPSLHVIPCDLRLQYLNLKLDHIDDREYFFTKNLIPLLSDFEVVIFDNSPAWDNKLLQAALTASNTIICPFGCEKEFYEGMETSLALLNNFKEELNLDWPNIFHVPTKYDATWPASKQIYDSYKEYYGKYLTNPIRESAAGENARGANQSVIEFDPTCPLANDYYDLLIGMWININH